VIGNRLVQDSASAQSGTRCRVRRAAAACRQSLWQLTLPPDLCRLPSGQPIANIIRRRPQLAIWRNGRVLKKPGVYGLTAINFFITRTANHRQRQFLALPLLICRATGRFRRMTAVLTEVFYQGNVASVALIYPRIEEPLAVG